MGRCSVRRGGLLVSDDAAAAEAGGGVLLSLAVAEELSDAGRCSNLNLGAAGPAEEEEGAPAALTAVDEREAAADGARDGNVVEEADG